MGFAGTQPPQSDDKFWRVSVAGLSGRLPARVLRKERLTSLILAVDLRHPLMHRNGLVFINGLRHLPEKNINAYMDDRRARVD